MIIKDVYVFFFSVEFFFQLFALSFLYIFFVKEENCGSRNIDTFSTCFDLDLIEERERESVRTLLRRYVR